MNGPLSLPPNLSAKLSDFRRRVWWVKLTEGLLAAIVGLAVSYIIVLVLDRFFDTPAWLRGGLLAAGALVLGLGLPLKWHKWVWRQRRLEDAARLLRWKFPRLGDQLLGIVELAKADLAVAGRSERLVQAAMAQADEAVKEQDFSDAVPAAKHRHWAWGAGAAAALITLGFFVAHQAASNALPRWLTPWKDTERFTYAQLQDLPNPLVVPLAEPFEVNVKLKDGSPWKPQSASGKIKNQPKITAERGESGYAMAFPPQRSDAEAKIKVGDARESLRIEPRPRPELTSLKIRQKLPGYLQYKTEPVTEVRGGAVSVLRGAVATIEAAASRELASAEVDGQAAKLQGETLISAPREISAETDVTIRWKDSLGLTARAPLELKMRAVEDESPRLVARRESLEQVVLDSEVVVFAVSATDDYGVKQVGLEWRGDESMTTPDKLAKGSKVAAAGAPETKQVETRATFCAKREGVAPQTLEIRAWAEDYLSGRERSRGATFILHVLNATDHAIWVTQQMAKWLEAAKETYEREQQLHETNKELRALSASDLDRPENRRRVAQQAAAENANGERLGALTNSGRNMLEQATKNPEFDAKRLESWALMLRTLTDISENRMPSVADLLKQSADAKADAKMASSSQTGPQQPAGPGAPSAAAPPGANDGQTEQNSPNSGQAKAGLPSENLSGPTLANGPQTPKASGPASGEAPNTKGAPPTPSISLTVGTMYDQKKKGDEPPAPPGGGAAKLGLPSVSLAPPPKKNSGGAAPPASSAQQNLDDAVTEQRDLLAEFAKVADQLGEILASLEASTFVKRFKEASRQQTLLAAGLSQETLEAFGVARENPEAAIEQASEPKVAETKGPEPPKEAPKPDPAKPETEIPFVTVFAPAANTKAKEQSEFVKLIQGDLEAYYQRRQEMHFKKVIGEMKQTRVVEELCRVGERAADNLNGNAIHGAEFWADTLDRWGEEMVAVVKGFC